MSAAAKPAGGVAIDSIDRDAFLAAIRADVRELTEPMTVTGHEYRDQPDGHSKKFTHVVDLPDLVEQLHDAAIEPVRDGEQIPIATSATGSRPPIDLDPHAVLRRITQQARGWVHTVAPDRDFDAEAAVLRRKLDTANRHLATHQRNLRLAQRRRDATDRLTREIGPTHPQYNEARRRGNELADLASEIVGYIATWEFEVGALKDRIATAEGPRGAVLALNGVAGQLDDRDLVDLEATTRRWVSSARIAAHVDDKPVQLDEHCPHCGARGTLTISRGEFGSGRCSNCRRAWSSEDLGVLTRMLDAQRDAERKADVDLTVQDEPVLGAIDAALRSAGVSRSEFAELLGKSKRHVVQVLAGSARASDRLLWSMVDAAAGLEGDHAPQLLLDLIAQKANPMNTREETKP